MPSSNHTHLQSLHGDRTIVIMAKAPRLGMVKSRLTPQLDPSDIVELYRCLLEDTVALTLSLPAVDVAIMCPSADVEDLASIVGGRVQVVPQKGIGLAAALTTVFDHFTSTHRRVIALDSDSPHVPDTILHSAFDKLVTADLVVGPTHDGGYYLVGATATHPGLFDGDGMGTTTALDTLLARARAMRLSVGFTEPFYDIDVEVDLKRLAAELQIAPQRAPRTAAWLTTWKPMQALQQSSADTP